MNNQDLFLQLIAKPHPTVSVRTDLHWLQVSQGKDILYFGGGATKQDFFGYGGTAAGGDREVGYVTEISVSWKPLPVFELAGYYGHAFGDTVVHHGFPGNDDLNYGYVETTISF
jgi:hypothetical protein